MRLFLDCTQGHQEPFHSDDLLRKIELDVHRNCEMVGRGLVTTAFGKCEVDSFDSRRRPVAGFCEHGNEPSSSI